MAPFNPFVKLAEQTSSTMMRDAFGNGAWDQVSIDTPLYRCQGLVPETNGTRCNLVWTRRHQARDCASRNHRNQYADTYYRQVTIDNQTHIVEERFVRQAVRRDGPRPVKVAAQAPEPEPQLTVVPETSLSTAAQEGVTDKCTWSLAILAKDGREMIACHTHDTIIETTDPKLCLEAQIGVKAVLEEMGDDSWAEYEF